ncbi:YggT family protein [Marinobacterium arenosum]|uniref:YggT family protein n=1 Tax=Marinobacterium arenosum TaxID=2862496 RepID=UPI001C95964B|nr:YggT family protein [Marinobacterium arenosum]MBY4676416.1 YggT family protein [Marinobacterium arenosum]
MGQDPITLIISTLGNLYAFIVVLRFLLQLAQADYYNPISQAVVKATNPPLMPLQKVLPRMGRWDLSALVLAALVKFGTLLLIFVVHDNLPNIAGLALFSLVGVLDLILTIYFWAVLAAVIISWVAPNSYHPAPQLLLQLTEPLFALVRKVIPPLGGLDLSPIFIFLAIQIIQSQLSRLVI